ncbi:MAG: hypothetical protein M1282_09505 [Chloroflexi bacterium]|nr:hypothetical protein [Chloroflexota bacterium]
MKLFKLGLRIWIAITSVGTFMVGWIMIAHAPKPVQPASSSSVSVAPLPTLAPLAPLNFSNNGAGQSQSFTIQQAPAQAPIQNFFSQPSFRTSGS